MAKAKRSNSNDECDSDLRTRLLKERADGFAEGEASKDTFSSLVVGMMIGAFLGATVVALVCSILWKHQ